VIGSIRRECLDYIVICNERHLLLRSWVRMIITYSSRNEADATTNISIAAIPAA
jgi:hypothetical protein